MLNKMNKIVLIFMVFVLLVGCFAVPSYAASYGEDVGENIIDIPTGTSPENGLFRIPKTNQTPNTMIFLMDYMRYLYSYNMTNGQKPFLVILSTNAVEIYVVPVETENVYVSNVVQSGTNNLFHLSYTSTPTYQRYILHEFGNFVINNTVQTNTSISASRNYSYIYINENNTYSYYAASNDSTNAVYFDLYAMYSRMKNFVDGSYGSNTSMQITEHLDVGSIISSVMTAPMSIFGGLTGTPGDTSQPLELFGINIRSTLIAFIVIAIVIFIIKFLRGD